MTEEIPGTLLLDAKVIDDPYPFYRRLQPQAPVWEIPGTGVVHGQHVRAVGRGDRPGRRLLVEHQLSALPRRRRSPRAVSPTATPGVQALATADPPAHALHRSTVFPELVAKRMAELEPDVVDIADACVSGRSTASVEFMTAIGNVVPITMISRLIGFRDSDLDQLLRAAFDSTAMLGSTLTLDELIEHVGRTGEIQTWIADQLSTAMTEPADDLLGAVARGVDAGVRRRRGQRHLAHLAERRW